MPTNFFKHREVLPYWTPVHRDSEPIALRCLPRAGDWNTLLGIVEYDRISAGSPIVKSARIEGTPCTVRIFLRTCSESAAPFGGIADELNFVLYCFAQ
jgi:hypothetical protein